MKLATTTSDFSAYTLSQIDSIKWIHSAGFRYLDYSFGMDYSNHSGVFASDWRPYLRSLRRQADELQISFIQAHAPMGSPIAQNEDQQVLIDVTKHCIRCCKELGIENIVVHSGYEPQTTKEQTFKRNKAFYMKLLRYAEKYNINILTENFNSMCIPGIYWIDSAADLKELVEYVDHPLFHACWDVGHGNMGSTPQDESLRILGDTVYALHVQDNAGERDTHFAPFFGTTNFDSVMCGLHDINYQGFFTFEATNLLGRDVDRNVYHREKRLHRAPLELRIHAESLLYEIGKSILSAYHCYES